MSANSDTSQDNTPTGNGAVALASLGIGSILVSYSVVDIFLWIFAYLIGYGFYFLSIRCVSNKNRQVATVVFMPQFIASLVANAIVRNYPAQSVNSPIIGCMIASVFVTLYGMVGVIAMRKKLMLYHFFIAAVPVFMVNWRLYS